MLLLCQRVGRLQADSASLLSPFGSFTIAAVSRRGWAAYVWVCGGGGRGEGEVACLPWGEGEVHWEGELLCGEGGWLAYLGVRGWVAV